MPNQIRVFFAMLLLMSATGCAEWSRAKPHDKAAQPFTFPSMRMSADAVGLEIGLAQLDASQADQLEVLWRTLDQQKLPLDQRQQLDRNGLKCAVMSTRPPAVFHALFEPYLPDPDTLDPVARQMALAGQLQPIPRLKLHRRISNREGETYEVKTSDPQPVAKWILHEHASHTTGEARSACGAFDITTFPQSDGSVRLKLLPTIHHGEERPRIAVAHGAFIRDHGQLKLALDSLKFDLQLRVGETLIVASTAGGELPGNLLFGSQIVGGSQRVLLVRLVQTQMNDLFDRSASIEKLNTTPNH